VDKALCGFDGLVVRKIIKTGWHAYVLLTIPRLFGTHHHPLIIKSFLSIAARSL
jgi:hypothetical protein